VIEDRPLDTAAPQGRGQQSGSQPLPALIEQVERFFPQEILSTLRWCFWDKTPRPDGRPSKKPLNPNTGKSAKTNTPSTFTDFETAAKAALADERAGGIGFLLAGGQWIGLDLDHVIDATTGEVNAKAHELLGALSPTYVERSPGGDGLHVLLRGSKPQGEGWPSMTKDAFGPGTALEVYDGNDRRYFTATGDVWADKPIATATESDTEALAAFMQRPDKVETPSGASRSRYERSVFDEDARNLDRARFGLLDLGLLDNDVDDEPSWFNAMVGLKPLGEPGRELAMEWSKRSPKFDAITTHERWDRIEGTSVNKLFGKFKAVNPGWSAAYEALHAARWTHSSPDVEDDPGTRQESRRRDRSQANPWQRFSLDEYLKRKNGLWSIHGLYREAQVVMLGAFPSVGKSTLATGLIAATLYGSPWCGRKALGGSVVAFVGEGRLGFVRRLDAERKKRGGPWPEDRYFELIDFELPLSSSDGHAEMRRLLRLITDERGIAPALVVVDTMASHWAAEEDSQEHTGPFMKAMGQLASEFGCAVVIVHHTTKIKGKYTAPELQDIRGSGALVGGADVVLGLHSTEDDSGVVLRTLKTKDDEPGPDICLTREVIDLGVDEQGDPLTAARFDKGDLGLLLQQQTRAEAAKVEKAEQFESRLLAGMRDLDGKITNKDTLFKRVEGKTGDLRGAFGRLVDTGKVLYLGHTQRTLAYYLPTHPDVPALRGDDNPKSLVEKVEEARAGVCVTKEPKGGGAEPPAPLSPGDRPEEGGGEGRKGAKGRSKPSGKKRRGKKQPPASTIDDGLPEQPTRRSKKSTRTESAPLGGGAA